MKNPLKSHRESNKNWKYAKNDINLNIITINYSSELGLENKFPMDGIPRDPPELPKSPPSPPPKLLPMLPFFEDISDCTSLILAWNASLIKKNLFKIIIDWFQSKSNFTQISNLRFFVNCKDQNIRFREIEGCWFQRS